MAETAHLTPPPLDIEAGELIVSCGDCQGEAFQIIMASTKWVSAYRCLHCGNEIVVKQNAN